MFTDIVDSTQRASAMGDRAWRDLLDAQNDVLRHELVRFRGREVKTLGDGMLATFDGPARAIRCGLAMTQAVRSLGIEVRVGLHTGDGKTHLVRETLQRIEEKLDPAVFARVHRTAIARLDQVSEIRTDSAERQFVVLRNGTRLPLGKSRREALERVLASR